MTSFPGAAEGPGANRPVIIQNIMPKPPWLGRALVRLLLVISLFANLAMLGVITTYMGGPGATEKFKSGDRFAPDKIAIIRVHDMITMESIAAPKKELKAAEEDEGVKAIVLDIDSPGGTISASDELYHAIVRYKEKTQKPVVASMNQIGTSGAYYIAMPADKIMADRSCITGSIGVIASMFNLEKLLNNWGIAPETIKSGKMKDAGSFTRAMTPEERAFWQSTVDKMFEQFFGVVFKHRGKKIGGEEKLRKLADGRIFLANESKELGLIDEIGYQEDAIEEARKLANLPEKVRVVTYSRPISGLFSLLEEKSNGPGASLLNQLATPRIFLLPGGMMESALLAPLAK